jgi:hypothetical protein
MNQAIMNEVIVAEQGSRLSRTERLQLAWALSWPCVLLLLVEDLLHGQLRLTETPLQSIDWVFCLIQLFVVTPWVVCRIVRLNFPGFHLLVVRGDAGEGTRTMSYRESLSVSWLMTWRSVVIFVLIFLAALVALAAVAGPESLRRPMEGMYGLLGFSGVSAGTLLINYLWIAKAALRKRYSGFSLRLDRSAL